MLTPLRSRLRLGLVMITRDADPNGTSIYDSLSFRP